MGTLDIYSYHFPLVRELEGLLGCSMGKIVRRNSLKFFVTAKGSTQLEEIMELLYIYLTSLLQLIFQLHIGFLNF